MHTDSELAERISEIDRYTELGSKLEKLVSDEKDLQSITTSLSQLTEMKSVYQTEIKLNTHRREIELEEARIKEDEKRKKDELIKEYSPILGRTEVKRIIDDSEKNSFYPLKEAWKTAGKGFIYGLLSVISLPFSKKYSFSCLDTSKSYFGASRSYFHTSKMQDETKKIQIKNLQRTHELEFLEAEVGETYKKIIDLSDESLMTLLDRPELIYCSVLETIRGKNFPWL